MLGEILCEANHIPACVMRRVSIFFWYSSSLPHAFLSYLCSLALALALHQKTARPEVAQTRRGSYLLEGRVLRVTAGCSLFLDYQTGARGWKRDGEKSGGWRMQERWRREKEREREKENERWMGRVRRRKMRSLQLKTLKLSTLVYSVKESERERENTLSYR